MSMQLRANAEELANRSLPTNLLPMRGGIARGARVMTARGEVAVEALRPGDRLVTREHGMARLRAVAPFQGRACTVSRDSFGPARPARRTVVAEDQHLTLRDWRAGVLYGATAAMVPAERLCDGTIVARIGTTDLYRLDLGGPLTIYVDGLETATGRTEEGVVDRSDAI